MDPWVRMIAHDCTWLHPSTLAVVVGINFYWSFIYREDPDSYAGSLTFDNFDKAVEKISSKPEIENIWVVGGTGIYKVRTICEDNLSFFKDCTLRVVCSL